jgi:hypothetical protein
MKAHHEPPQDAPKMKGLRPTGANARKPLRDFTQDAGDLYRRRQEVPRAAAVLQERADAEVRAYAVTSAPLQDAPTANIVELGACRKDTPRPCIFIE